MHGAGGGATFLTAFAHYVLVGSKTWNMCATSKAQKLLVFVSGAVSPRFRAKDHIPDDRSNDHVLANMLQGFEATNNFWVFKQIYCIIIYTYIYIYIFYVYIYIYYLYISYISINIYINTCINKYIHTYT